MTPGQVVDRAGAARIFGVSGATIDQWLSDGCPAERAGRKWQIDTALATRWLRDRERKQALGEVAAVNEADARRRKLAAEAVIAEAEAAIKTGQAVAISDWQAAMAAMIGNSRAKLLGIAAKAAPMVAIESDAAACESILDGLVAEALIELSADGIPDQQPGVGKPAVRGAKRSRSVGASA